jgi:cold shock CspA family protein
MNKSFIRRAAIVVTAVSLASVPLFAKTPNRNKGEYYNDDSDGDRFERPCDNFNGTPGRMSGMGFFGMGGPGAQQTMGTVSTVNKETGLITVTDVDGKEVQIHVSPVTRFAETRPQDPTKAKIDSIVKGDWIMVTTFNTNTKILEAASLFVEHE